MPAAHRNTLGMTLSFPVNPRLLQLCAAAATSQSLERLNLIAKEARLLALLSHMPYTLGVQNQTAKCHSLLAAITFYHAWKDVALSSPRNYPDYAVLGKVSLYIEILAAVNAEMFS
ncbi:hypothetical protein Bbelb_168860 [Branchiostoma belcheri]|nr:hypothetical protein Bbelb_168860 [Branchiostoma belcheri]